MSDLINILLQATVDPKAIVSIQKQIEDISKNAKAIKINVEVDGGAIKAIENINKTIAKMSQSSISSINTSQVESGLQRITEHYKQGEAVASSMTKTTVAGFEKTVEVLRRVEGAYTDSQKKNVTYDYEKERKSIETIADAREKSSQKIKEENKLLDERQSKQINKTLDDEYKARLKLNEQLDLYKQKMLGGDGFSGELDIFAGKQKGKFDERALTKIRSDIEGLNISTPNLNNKMKQLGVQFNSLKQSASQSGSVVTRMFDNMTKFMRFYLAGGILVRIVSEIRNGVESVKLLDSSLTELAKVSDLTSTQLSEFTDRAYEVGKTIGRTGKEVIDATAEFKRAGYEIEQAFDLSQQALLLTNIGDGIDDVKEASSSLIAILKGFKMEASETAHIVDALNEVSNNYAVDTNNLTSILKRASGTIGQTGTSYEQLIGLATGGYESLRNAEMVASGKMFCPYVQKCA